VQVTAPSGRTYEVRRRWLPWRQRIPLDTELVVTLLAAVELVVRIVLTPVAALLRVVRLLPWVVEVRDPGARKEATVVSRERVLGWGPSSRRMASLVGEVESQVIDPAGPGFGVTLTRDPVSARDDLDDHTTILELDHRTSEPTLSMMLGAVQARGRFISIAGDPTTWALRETGRDGAPGRPLAVLVVTSGSPHLDVHPVGEMSHRVAKDGRFHLEYLLTQSVEQTLAMIAADPKGKRSLRIDRQA
jgi:hypothetical protein